MIKPVMFLVLLLPTTLFAAERVVERSIPVNQDVRVSIENQRGGIEIRTGSVDSIELIAIIEHDDIEILSDVDIDVRSSASTVDIHVDYNRPFTLSLGFIGLSEVENPSVRFVLTVPDQASLSLTAHRSVFNIQAPSGRVEIFSQRGGGQITNVRNDLEIDVNRGSFSIEIQELHNIDITSRRGDIELNIHDAKNYRLLGKFRSTNLSVTDEQIAVNRRDEDYSSIDHIDGDGRSIISLDTRRGNSSLNFQD